MIKMWRLAHAFGHRFNVYYRYPDPLVLSGTPLNEAMVALHKILPKFQKENNVEKVQCIVLTDGEANYLPYHKEVDEDKPKIHLKEFLKEQEPLDNDNSNYIYYQNN